MRKEQVIIDEMNSSSWPKPAVLSSSHFLWGASVASHQVEGGTHNQWSQWEQVHADELARTAGQRLSWLPDWDKVKVEAEQPDNYISGKGVEHYQKYSQDFDLLGELGLSAFRFGIEWSRLEPAEGQWDTAVVEHYRAYIAELRRRGIEPILTIWHWTLPVWFASKGGFKSRANLKYFDRFVQLVAQEFTEGIKYVLTLNEPNVYAGLSYKAGEWPPAERSLVGLLRVYWSLAQAHRRAYKILKAVRPELHIGLAAQLSDARPKRPGNLYDKTAAGLHAYAWNWWFIDRLRGRLDFIGVNYYFTDYYRGFKTDNPKEPLSDLGWYMEPSGLYNLLKIVNRRYRLPILITENGLADSSDSRRVWWIDETISALQKAADEGVKLIGYLHWSLLDNFEWKYGWWPHFGLVAVDRQNGMRRTIRQSARHYAARIKKLT